MKMAPRASAIAPATPMDMPVICAVPSDVPRPPDPESSAPVEVAEVGVADGEASVTPDVLGGAVTKVVGDGMVREIDTEPMVVVAGVVVTTITPVPVGGRANVMERLA